LTGALVEAIGEHGYGALRTREICELAGVSKGTLYRHFKGGVHGLFMAAFEQVSDELSFRLVQAWRQGEGPQERISLAVAAFAETVASEPTAARLALCEPFAAGPGALRAMHEVQERLAVTLARALEEGSGTPPPPPLAVRGVIAGLGGVARARLLEHRAGELPCEVAQLSEWALRCLLAPAALDEPGEAVPVSYTPSAGLLGGAAHSGGEPRSRILAATATLAARRGYEGLRERVIRGAARVTRAQFREHFEDEHAAFVSVLELLWARALRHATGAASSAPSWEAGLPRAVATLMDCLATDRAFARLAFIELPAAGVRGLRDRERLIGAAAQRLIDSAPARRRPLGTLAAHASLAAAWAIARERIVQGEGHSLAAVAPTLSYLALAPAIGAQCAAQAVTAEPLRQGAGGLPRAELPPSCCGRS
jgi:AcrR family transcriptional regulator